MNTEVHQEVIHIFVVRGKEQLRLEFTSSTTTGLEIKARAGGSTADGLYTKVQGKPVEIADDEVLHLKQGEHFTLIPNGKVS